MDRGEAVTQSRAPGSGAQSGKLASAVGRTVATLAVVVALVLWFAAESAYPAGAWIEQRGETWLAIALAVVILFAACVSSLAALAFSMLAGAAFAGVHMNASPASLTLAAVSVATLGYAIWQNPATIRGWIPPWLLVAGAVTIPIGLWLSVHVAPSAYAAGLGALLTTLVLYAFMRRGPAAGDIAESGQPSETPPGQPDPSAAAKSLLLAMAGFGLLARML
jgi:hypothetical protein